MKPEVGSPIFELSDDGLGTIRFAPADSAVLVSYLMDSIKVTSRTVKVSSDDAFVINQMSRMVYELLSSPEPVLTSLSEEDVSVLRDMCYDRGSFNSQIQFLRKALTGVSLRPCQPNPVMADSAGKSISSVMDS